ncbi:cell shape determining protein, MreB/Mrl family [Veillonellaceae bacterium DNF00626]|nr:cell shape determining protein, MreB/Mrl family [Veillonellaceae bacterium DNF00626]
MNRFSRIGNRLGIDIGSSQVRIYTGEKIILEEASCAAVDNVNGMVLGYGTDALVRSHSYRERCHLEWAVHNGVMSDYNITKGMLRYFINKAVRHAVSRPHVMASVSCELSSVVRHALVDALMHGGAQKVSLISSPAAAAIGGGVVLDLPEAVLSVVIGRDVTDVGIYCCGGKVYEKSVAFGGHNIDEEIYRFLQEDYNILVGMEQAERLKREWISVVHTGENRTFTVRGRRMSDGVEIIIELAEHHLLPLMQRILLPVSRLIKNVLQKATPEIAEDLMKNGMVLSGGTARLPGLSDWISAQIGIPVFVSDKPDCVVAKGCYLALSHIRELPLLVEAGEKYYGGIS